MYKHLINNALHKQTKYAKDLNCLENAIADFLGSNSTFRELTPFILNRGKRIRSILYFMHWDNSAIIHPDVKYKTIALIELIHFASILHDDVIDNNMVRRNSASFLSEYGAEKSIVHGDLLLVKAIDELLKLHHDNELVKNFCIRECSATAYGAILERNLTLNSSFQDCLRASALKTASLFKLCCFLSSLISSNDFELSKKSAIFGLCFGVLFQFQNDLDSYSSPDCRNSEDFMQKNITLPLIILRDKLHFDVSKFKSLEQIVYNEIQNLMHSPAFQKYAEEKLNKFSRIVNT